MTATDGIQRHALGGHGAAGTPEVAPETTSPGTSVAGWHVLDRRIAYLARASGLLRGDFLLPAASDRPDDKPEPESLNTWPARFLTAVAQEDDAAFVRRYATLFVSEPRADAPLVGVFDRLVDVPSLATCDGVLGRWLDAEDIIHIGDLLAVRRQQGGSPLLLTMADVHPALAVSRWCLVTDARQRERFEPWLRLLRTLGTEDFDPLAMQCRVLELRERLREVQLEAERVQSAQAAEFERHLHAELQKKDQAVASVWHAKDEEIARLGAELHAARAQEAQLTARLGELERELAEMQSALQSCQAELHRTQQQAAQCQRQLDAILASRSWRLTAPLRQWLGRKAR